MAGLSLYGRDQQLAAFFMPDLFDAPPSVWVALTTTVPTIGDTGDNLHEPADGLYAREEYMLGSGAWAPTGRGGVANSADISFGIPGADWGNVVGWALCSGMSLRILLSNRTPAPM